MSHIGQHRADRGEVRLRNRLDQLRRHHTPRLVRASIAAAALLDWGRVLWRDITNPRRVVA